MKTKLIALILAALAISVGYAQTTVVNYTAGVTSDAVVYYLPQTEFRIAITATRTTQYPGDFHKYAQRFLRLNDAVSAKSTNWQIEKVQFLSVGTPDTSKVYAVTLKKGTSAPLCTLTDDGMLLAINAESQPYVAPELENIHSQTTTKVNSRNYLNQEILSAGSELKMAELTAAEIYNIRESRSELTKGEADYMPKDGEQLRLMLSKLDEQEEALLQLFSGYKETETKTWFLTYTPQYGRDQDVIARFSDQTGLVSATDLSGAPLTLRVTNKNTVAHGRTEILLPKLQNKVVYYNVPSQASVELLFQGQQLLQTQQPIAQFGHEEYLADDLFNHHTTCHIWFNPVTGNILKIEDDTPAKTRKLF